MKELIKKYDDCHKKLVLLLETTPMTRNKQYVLSEHEVLMRLCEPKINSLRAKLFQYSDLSYPYLHDPIKLKLEEKLSKLLKQCIEDHCQLITFLIDGLPNKKAMGSFWDITSWFNTSSSENIVPDSQRAEKALYYWHTEAGFYPQNYSKTFDELKSEILAKSPAFLEGLGLAINSIGLDEGTVESTMSKLADKGEGRLPENLTVFFNAVGEAGKNPSFWDGITFAASRTFDSVTEGLVEFGTSATEALKTTSNLTKYLPWIALGLGGLYVYTIAGGSFRSVRGKSAPVPRYTE